MRIFLDAPSYVLGEVTVGYEAIPGIRERARELGLQPDAELWGWGQVHRTVRGAEAMAIETAEATLRMANVRSSSIDLLMLCSTQFAGDGTTHGGFVQSIMTRLGLDSACYLGLTLNRCTNLLAALRTGEALVASGHYRRILVVTVDRAERETSRLDGFALFSDGAASCLLTADDGSYEVLASASAQRPDALDWSNEISAELSCQVNERLLTPRGITTSDLAGLMHSNIFKPILVMKERLAGFAPAQLFTGNITRVGHCFAADPLINLVDRTAFGHLPEGALAMLAASVPGSRVGVLLRRTPRTTLS